MKRKICIITGSRAEYGLLKPLIEEVKQDKDLTLLLIATGMHLSSEFGLTYEEIEKDGFIISKKIDINLHSDSSIAISKSIALAISKFSETYKALKPDIVVVLGDRFEILGVTIAAFVAKIPVAHIGGGELTEGALDDSFRHSITKMSYLHFASTKEYRNRIMQLGENPKTIFNVGAIGLDGIRRSMLLSKEELEKKLSLKFNRRNLLITFHPVTLEDNTAKKQLSELLYVLDGLKDISLIFTKANADPESKVINKTITEYVRKNSEKAYVFSSMGQLNYFSTMQFVDAVVGNSSSGIIEAPASKIGTINIGDRQKGRIKAKSIIDCKPERSDIENAIRKLYSSKFQKGLKDTINFYGDGYTAVKIKDVLKNCNLENISKKKFYNLDFNGGR